MIQDFQVPSLYVRVYRREEERDVLVEGSLTIREGVSNLLPRRKKKASFPHYT